MGRPHLRNSSTTSRSHGASICHLQNSHFATNAKIKTKHFCFSIFFSLFFLCNTVCCKILLFHGPLLEIIIFIFCSYRFYKSENAIYEYVIIALSLCFFQFFLYSSFFVFFYY